MFGLKLIRKSKYDQLLHDLECAQICSRMTSARERRRLLCMEEIRNMIKTGNYCLVGDVLAAINHYENEMPMSYQEYLKIG